MAKRIDVLKTHKIFIGGKFPRTESGRYYTLFNKDKAIANICLSSRKDVRNAVVSARKAFGGWSAKSAYNRAQILYRIAEMIEGRRAQFISEIISQGKSKSAAETEINTSIDRVIYYAGWCDKINQIFGSVNPVASSHFNFSLLEPMGVVGVVAPKEHSLLGVISCLIPPLAGGNTVVVLSSEEKPLCSVTLSEVIATSDVPSGVVNILTGKQEELIPHLSSHMDVNAIFYCNDNKKEIKEIQLSAVDNLKRIVLSKTTNWNNSDNEQPYLISGFMETKTTWHPIENIAGSGSGY
jgi:acyl-CoA reductase-like NAD-dependent aldehyde dehydrogenase